MPINYIEMSDGTKAITHFNGDTSFKPDYIFLDLNMPLMDGKQCLKELRQMAQLNKVPVVIYSNSGNPADEQETLQLNATHYLIKPTNMQLLTNILCDLFASKDMPFLLLSKD